MGMVLTSTHLVPSLPLQEGVKELSGGPPISLAFTSGSGGPRWDTKRAYCVEMWRSLCVWHKF